MAAVVFGGSRREEEAVSLSSSAQGRNRGMKEESRCSGEEAGGCLGRVLRSRGVHGAVRVTYSKKQWWKTALIVLSLTYLYLMGLMLEKCFT